MLQKIKREKPRKKPLLDKKPATLHPHCSHSWVEKQVGCCKKYVCRSCGKMWLDRNPPYSTGLGNRIIRPSQNIIVPRHPLIYRQRPKWYMGIEDQFPFRGPVVPFKGGIVTPYMGTSGGMGGVSAVGATAYCTGAATCTATTPGNCELLCEDAAGSENCDSDNSPDIGANCRNGWVATVQANTSIDTAAAHSGTFACTDKGAKALQFTSTNANNIVYLQKDFESDNNISYVQLYFNLVSGVTSTTQDVAMIGAHPTGFALTIYRVGILNTSGTLNLKLGYWDDIAGDIANLTGATALSRDTWYRLRVVANKTAGTIVVYLNDTTEFSVATYTNDYGFGAMRVGSVYSYATHVLQIDNIAVSAVGAQGTCN